MDNIITAKSKKGFFSYSVFTTAVAVSLGLGYFTYRLASAEYAFGQSLTEAAANRGNTTYSLQIQAIRANPFENRYRISYSQTNLAIANSIAGREKVSDQDRSTIQQLISQAIREGKNAVSINQLNAGNWSNLAGIYRSLVNVAADASQWAVATFQQAIALDPNNPQLRLNYGQLLFSLNQFESAQRQFEAATALKPDMANAHYNLGIALKQQNKLARAKFQLEQTLALVQAGSTDYKNVQNELETVNKLIAKNKSEEQKIAGAESEEITAESKLTAPEESSPAASLEPRLKLSEEEAPPEAKTAQP